MIPVTVMLVLGVVFLTWCLVFPPVPMSRGVFWTYVVADVAVVGLVVWAGLILAGVVDE